MTQLSFASHIDGIRERLRGNLPGMAVQLTMAPEIRENISMDQARKRPCRDASVMLLLFPSQEQPALVLTVRPPHMKQHPGQISFPGGRREPGEDLLTTALRETQEEIGLEQDQIEVLGRLTPLYIPPSNFCVYPFVGALTHDPPLTPHSSEVEEILRIPLWRLLQPDARVHEAWMLRGKPVQIPHFRIDRYQIWGATAMILAELLALFDDVEALLPAAAPLP